MSISFVNFTQYLLTGPPREFKGSGEKEIRPPASGASRKFQDLEISYGKLLLVYFTRPPDLEALSDMRPRGNFPPVDNQLFELQEELKHYGLP